MTTDPKQAHSEHQRRLKSLDTHINNLLPDENKPGKVVKANDGIGEAANYNRENKVKKEPYRPTNKTAE